MHEHIYQYDSTFRNQTDLRGTTLQCHSRSIEADDTRACRPKTNADVGMSMATTLTYGLPRCHSSRRRCCCWESSVAVVRSRAEASPLGAEDGTTAKCKAKSH